MNREIVTSHLGVYGYQVKDVGSLNAKNCVEKLDGYDVVLLSLVKNPQAVEQAKAIGRELKNTYPGLKIVVVTLNLQKKILEKHMFKSCTNRKH